MPLQKSATFFVIKIAILPVESAAAICRLHTVVCTKTRVVAARRRRRAATTLAAADKQLGERHRRRVVRLETLAIGATLKNRRRGAVAGGEMRLVEHVENVVFAHKPTAAFVYAHYRRMSVDA